MHACMNEWMEKWMNEWKTGINRKDKMSLIKIIKEQAIGASKQMREGRM